jgi:hypothetical protein
MRSWQHQRERKSERASHSLTDLQSQRHTQRATSQQSQTAALRLRPLGWRSGCCSRSLRMRHSPPLTRRLLVRECCSLTDLLSQRRSQRESAQQSQTAGLRLKPQGWRSGCCSRSQMVKNWTLQSRRLPQRACCLQMS